MKRDSAVKSLFGIIPVMVITLLAGCATQRQPPAVPSQPFETAPHERLPSGPAAGDLAESVKLNTHLAAAYLQSGRPDVASEVISRALAADPNSALALAVQGLVYGETKDFARGDESFKKALAIAPRDPDLNHNFAMYLCRSGRASRSIEFFENALQTPGYARALASESALGTCLIKTGQVSAAEARFNHVLSLDIAHPGAQLGLAEVAATRQDWPTVREILRRHGARSQVSPQSLWLSLQLERASGNMTESVGLAADLVRLFPGSEQAQRVGEGTLVAPKK